MGCFLPSFVQHSKLSFYSKLLEMIAFNKVCAAFGGSTYKVSTIGMKKEEEQSGKNCLGLTNSKRN